MILCLVLETYTVRKSVKFYTRYVNLKKIPLYSTGENCVLIWKLFNKRTADEYDDMFTSGCNLIVCFNRRLNRRLNVGRTSQWCQKVPTSKRPHVKTSPGQNVPTSKRPQVKSHALSPGEIHKLVLSCLRKISLKQGLLQHHKE